MINSMYVAINNGKNGKYAVLMMDLGYRKAFVSFDRNLCAELAGITLMDLYAKEIGTVIPLKVADKK